MTSDLNVVEAFITAINRRNLHEISGLMTADHTFVDSLGNTVSGREPMTSGWEHFFSMFPDFKIEIEGMLGDQYQVAVFGSTSGTFNGRRGLVPENRIKMLAAWRAVVAGGKIKHWQVYADWTEGCKIIEADQRCGTTT